MKGFEFFLTEDVTDIKSALTDLFASLRAAESVHRSGYWKAKGENHYGLHIMFKHINDPIDEQLDELGNQAVNNFGDEVVDGDDIEVKTNKYVINANKESDAVASSVWIEKVIQKNLKSVYDKLKSTGKLTLGLDELLMGVAKEHDDAMYHLTRTQG